MRCIEESIIKESLSCMLPPPMIHSAIVVIGCCLAVVGCTSEPPSNRPNVSLPTYDKGDSLRGEQLYEEACSQCHQLQLGNNKKGPQLLGIYGAPAAYLKDYKYSDALVNSGWVWDAETLNRYIADPVAVLPDTRMLSDPMPNETDRRDIIAYLSTLEHDISSDLQSNSK